MPCTPDVPGNLAFSFVVFRTIDKVNEGPFLERL